MFFFFSSRRRHTRFDCDWSQTCALPIVPVTVKHRIGIDKDESYEFVRDFVGTVADAGCRVFIVHARNAWLKGLSPKENREIPPLRYEIVARLKQIGRASCRERV